MNIISTIAEIGILETARIISKNKRGILHTSGYLPPLDSEYIENITKGFATTLVRSEKQAVFLMLPEIALLEKLSELKWKGTVILALPFDMDNESKERIHANIPDGVCTSFIDEGTYPGAFRPDNGVVVCTGIAPSGYRQYLLPACCRMMSLYKVFQGERMLLSCFPSHTRVPEIGWSYTETDYFNRIVEEVA